MKRIAAYMLGMALLPLLVILLAIISSLAQAQVTDRPILKLPTDPALVAVNVDGQQACAAWWTRDADAYGDFHLSRAFCRGDRCNLIGTDLARMIAARTEDVKAADVAPCMDKLRPPPSAWVIAPTTSGKRPAYLLKPDGTRGVQSGYAETTIGSGGTTVAMWCDCRVRSKETTSSAYCSWATARQTFDPAEPTRVSLCRASR